MTSQGLTFRKPTASDGTAVHQLIHHIPELDSNSVYCNLLQCSHFSETCVVAEIGGELVGFVSGYVMPQRPSTLFVWQVAVSRQARGKGVAAKMLQHLLGRDCCAAIAFLETTITEDNNASWSLFQGLAKRFCAPLERTVIFDRDVHFNALHDSEILARIGPLQR